MFWSSTIIGKKTIIHSRYNNCSYELQRNIYHIYKSHVYSELLLFGFMSQNVFAASCFWHTSSFTYLIPINTNSHNIVKGRVRENCTKRRLFPYLQFLHTLSSMLGKIFVAMESNLKSPMERSFSLYLVKENVLWKFYLRKNEAKIMYASFYFTNNTYKIKAGRHSCTDKFEFFLVRWPEISADFCTSRTHVHGFNYSYYIIFLKFLLKKFSVNFSLIVVF